LLILKYVDIKKLCLISYFKETKNYFDHLDIESDLKPQANDIFIGFNIKPNYFETYTVAASVCFTATEIGSAILFCLILRILRKNSNVYSPTTHRMHMQFSLLLASQLLAPIAFIFIPFALGTIWYLLGRPTTQLQDELGILAIVAYGASNSFLTVG
jgi:hypothetical protein